MIMNVNMNIINMNRNGKNMNRNGKNMNMDTNMNKNSMLKKKW
jgi:hypothetical protein